MTIDQDLGFSTIQNTFRQLLESVTRKTEDGTHELDVTLPAEEFGNIRSLLDDIDALDKSGAVQAALRGLLHEILNEAGSRAELFTSVANLLDLALILSEQDDIDSGLFFILSETFFESQALDAFKEFFRYYEAKVTRLKKDMDGTRGKGPILLRICNELLRRLPDTEEIFRGRIRIFLSHTFLLGEKSGVNHHGNFHTTNVTTFEVSNINGVGDVDNTEDAEGRKDESSPDQKEKEGVSRSGKPMSMDELYPIFWSLQGDFANPPRLFEPERFQRFKEGLAATLAKFKEISGNEDDDILKRTDRRKWENNTYSHFNPKYLTSRELFELEISDITFRRHILVQAYILIDFLLSLTPAAKEIWEKDKRYTNTTLKNAFRYTLPAEDEKWALSTKQKISDYLQPNLEGRLFFRSIETILNRDKNWVRWKMESCPSFLLDPLPAEKFSDITEKVKELCRPTKPYEFEMGTPALSRLWREGAKSSGLEALQVKERFTVPSPESFLPGIERENGDIDAPFFDEDFERASVAKASKTWRALRVSAKHDYHLFNEIEEYVKQDWENRLAASKRKAEEDGITWIAPEEKPEKRNVLHALLDAKKDRSEGRRIALTVEATADGGASPRKRQHSDDEEHPSKKLRSDNETEGASVTV